MKNLLLGFRMAVSLLSTIPFIGHHQFDTRLAGYAVLFYPIIGLLFGGIIYGADILLSGIFPDTFLPFLLFALFVYLSGAIHLDGLVDTADAWLSRQPDRAMEILKDPRVGGLGAVFLILFLVLKCAAFFHLENLLFFLVIPMLSRFGATIAIYHFPYISKGGMGESFKSAFTLPLLLATALITLLLSMTLTGITPLLCLLGCTLAVTLYFGSRFRRIFGGLNGDMYGFIIEANELALLILSLTLFS